MSNVRGEEENNQVKKVKLSPFSLLFYVISSHLFSYKFDIYLFYNNAHSNLRYLLQYLNKVAI